MWKRFFCHQYICLILVFIVTYTWQTYANTKMCHISKINKNQLICLPTNTHCFGMQGNQVIMTHPRHINITWHSYLHYVTSDVTMSHCPNNVPLSAPKYVCPMFENSFQCQSLWSGCASAETSQGNSISCL